MRQAHEQWNQEVNDLGQMPESEMLKVIWPPLGKQPTTAAPEITVSANVVTITSPTDGASIAYRVGREIKEDTPWKLYSKPFEIDGSEQVEAQAIRLGWKKSKVVRGR